MNTLPCAPSCCSPTQVVNVPGIAGDPGTAGVNGINAITTTTNNFSIPGVGVSIGVALANSAWMVPGQIVIMSGPANFLVQAVPTTQSATLQFLGYPGDVVPGTVIGAGALVSPAGQIGGGWIPCVQKADQFVINSNVVVNATGLQFSMLANTNYRIRGVIFFDTTAAGDFKYDFFAPAAPTLVRFERTDGAAGQAPAENPVDVATPGGTALTGAGTTGGYIRFDAIFQNGANSTLFTFQFSQNSATADSGAVVRAGSYIEYAVVQ